jgi:hypothetical protein
MIPLRIARMLLMGIAALFILYLITSDSEASEWKLMSPRELKVGYTDFFQGGRDPLITSNGLPNRTLGKEVRLTMDLDVLRYFYWHNNVHTMTDEIKETGGKGQFRTVGWELDFGVRASKYINIYFHHHSQHTLDTQYQNDGFPVQDGVGFQLNLLPDAHPSTDSLF